MRRIDIRGHADYVGSDARNRRLSRRRAETVKRFLLRDSGVPADLVDVPAYGETRALARMTHSAAKAQLIRRRFSAAGLPEYHDVDPPVIRAARVSARLE